MAATNRTDKIKQLFKLLQKRYKHYPKPVTRKVLESLMFAACLENSSYDAAESAFSVLEHHYIDWNEVRVSTPQELADTLPMLPNPLSAGERIKKTLQWVFETTYMFDLEEFRKKNISQAVEYFESIPSCTPFMQNYTIQMGLGGHQIPIDEAAMRIFRLLDLARVSKEQDKEEVSGLERTISKTQGPDFTVLIHLLGIEFFAAPKSPELLSLLKGIDSDVGKRSWEPPVLEVKKPATKPTVRPAPVTKSFTANFTMDDEDFETPETEDVPVKEESIEFIDHELVPLKNSAAPVVEEPLGDDEPDDKTVVKKKAEKNKPPQEPSVDTPVKETKEQPTVKEQEAAKEQVPVKKPESKKTKPADKPSSKTPVKKTTSPPKTVKKAEKNTLPKPKTKKAANPPKKTTNSSKKTTSFPKDAKSVKKQSHAKKLQQKKPR